jgi:hypothetical protein
VLSYDPCWGLGVKDSHFKLLSQRRWRLATSRKEGKQP